MNYPAPLGHFIKRYRPSAMRRKAASRAVGMVMTLHSQNISDLPNLPMFMEEHQISECYISLFRKTGLMGKCSLITPLSIQALSDANRMVTAWSANHSDLTIALLPVCTCGRTSVVVGADMTLRPCPFSYDFAVGNLTEDTFTNLWRLDGRTSSRRHFVVHLIAELELKFRLAA